MLLEVVRSIVKITFTCVRKRMKNSPVDNANLVKYVLDMRRKHKLIRTKEFNKAHRYLRKHIEAFREVYMHKNIVVTIDGVMGCFDDFEDACEFADKHYISGNYLIHYVETAEEEVKFVASAI